MKPYLSTLVSRKEVEIKSLMVNYRPKGLPFSALTSSGYTVAYKAYQLKEQGFLSGKSPFAPLVLAEARTTG